MRDLERKTAALGKTKAELLEMQAAELGLDASVVRPYLDGLEQLRIRTEAAANAQQEMAEAKAFAQQAAEAQQLVKASEYVRWWEDALEDVAAQERALAASNDFLQALERRVQAIGKTSSELLAMRAAELGVSDQAAPMIAQLAATERQLAGVGGVSAQTAAAMRMVPAQMTDIIVSLQGGQAPLTVLLQQGGQLKDMFGGIGPAAKALGGYVMGMVNPFTLAAAAAGALYMAYRTGAAEAEEFNRTLILTGNAVGLTTGQLQDMAKRLDGIAGTQRSATAALNEFAKSGKFGAASMEDFAASAIRWEDATGAAIADTVKQFEELGKSPLEASLKLNESMNYLTSSVYEQIKALEEQGRETEAAAIAQKAFADAIDERTPRILEQAGSIERGWRAVKAAVAEAIDAIAGVGRAGSAEQQIQSQIVTVTALQKKVDDLRARGRPVDGDLLAGLDAARGLLDDLQREYMQTATAAGAARKAQEEFAKARSVDAYLSDSSRMSRADQMKKDIAAEKAEYEKAVRNAQGNAEQLEKIERAHQESLKTIRDRYKEKGGSRGGISVTDTETANLRGRIEAEKSLAAQLEATSGMVSKLNEGERLSLQYSEKLKLATDAKTKARLAGLKAGADELGALQRSNSAIQEMAKIREREIDAQIKETESITNKAIAIEDEIAVYGLGKAAIEAMVIARLESKRAALIEMGASEDLIDALNREIAERQRLARAMGQKGVLDANSKAAEEAARDWERVTDQVGQSLSDAIFKGGKSGKELVEDLFRTMILRPVLQPVVQGGMNMVGQALNIPGAPGVKETSFDFGSLMGGGNISGSISNFADVAGVRLFNAGFEKVGSALVENSAAIGKFANGASQVFGYGKAIYDVTQGAYGSAIGTAVGTYILPGIGTAIGSMLGGMLDDAFQGETRSGAQYGLALNGQLYNPRRGTTVSAADGVRFLEGPSGGGDSEGVRNAIQSTVDAINGVFRTVGSDVALAGFWAGFEGSEKGRGGVGAGGSLSTGAGFGESGQGSNYKGTLFDPSRPHSLSAEEAVNLLPAQLAQASLQAWQAAAEQMPGALANILRGADLAGMGDEALIALRDQFVVAVAQAEQLRAGLAALPFPPTVAQTFAFAAALAEAAGGAENAANQLASYYQNYYSETERAAHLTAQLTERFEALGYTLPQTREEFRGLVEANMALGEGGARTTAELLAMESALASLLPTAEAVTEAARSAEDVARERLGLEGQLLQLLGNTTEIRRRELAALDESNRALQESIWFLQDQAEAAQLAREMAEARATDAMSILANAVNARKTELQKAFDQVADGLNTAINASQSTLQNLESLANSLKSTLRTMAGQFDPVMNRASAQAQIAQALATAQMTGVMPDVDDLQAALQVVAQPSEGLFSSFEEYQLDFLRTANDIDRLNSLTGDQLTAEEKALKTLREQLETETEQFEQEMERFDLMLELAQASLDAELGTLEAVMTIPEALDNMAAAMAALKATPSPSAGGGGGGGWKSGGSYLNDIYQDVFGRDIDQPGLDYWTGQLASGAITSDKLAQAIREGARNEDLTKLRGFAVGGYATPGWAMVGEEGPELVNFTNPGRVYTAQQTRDLMAAPNWDRYGRSDATVAVLSAAVDRLTKEVASLRADQKSSQLAIAKNTGRAAKFLEYLERWDLDGAPPVRDLSPA